MSLPATAQVTPQITSVTNSAGNVLSDLPSSGIAQGSLFAVKGTSLGPVSIVVATSFPLSTSIAGTSMIITVAGVTRDAIMYYSSATQIAAILPSSVPMGRGIFKITFQGTTSAAFPITVVKTTIGIFTLNTSGGGDAIATLGSGFVTPLNAAIPGDTVAFWGTGLGPVNTDEAQPAQQTDMTAIPVQAWVGGKPAPVVFRGRNGCCSAVDTIYVTIPAGVSGCVTPVVFQTGDYVSNTTTIPVASSGRTCTPNLAGVSSSDVQRLFSKATFSLGGIGLFRGNAMVVPTVVDGGSGTFVRTTPIPQGWGATSWDLIPPGSCVVDSAAAFHGAFITLQLLDAGAALTVSGAGGQRTVPRLPSPLVQAFTAEQYLGPLDFTGVYLRPGSAFTIAGSGTSDVGPFTATANFPDPLLQWTNENNITTIDRSQETRVTWTGGDPKGYVQIVGFSTAPGNRAAGSAFVCEARTADQSFTIPSYVLMAMVPSDPSVPGAIWPTSLWVQGFSAPTYFQANGLDLGIVSQWSNNGRTVSYTGVAGMQ